MGKLSLTVIFITLNEEFHIGDAIDNVKDIADEIFVVDSLSSDRTVDIALAKGAKVVQRPFTNFGDQWNFALDRLPIRTAWTMKMDPDERLTDELKSEIAANLKSPGEFDGFSFDRILYFMGRPMRSWKDRILRIWKSHSCHFTEVVVNEYPQISGTVKVLKGKMRHLDSRDLHQWVDKQNRYTTAEAIRRINGDKMAAEPHLFGNSIERRMFLKRLFFRLPGRYFLMFIHLYLFKGLWREGITGMHCLRLRMWGRRLIEAKLKEYRNTGLVPQLPPSAPHGEYHPAVLRSSLQQEIMAALPGKR